MNDLSGAMARFLDGAGRPCEFLWPGTACSTPTFTGAASRISPEAPVPVVNVSKRRYVAGGAANVAANARAMGAAVWLAGITGVDDSAVRLRERLSEAGIGADALLEDAARPTTTKTRITAAGQQIVRFDEEDFSPLSAALETELRALCQAALMACDVCVISDYAKGVVSDDFSQWLIGEGEGAKSAGGGGSEVAEPGEISRGDRNHPKF